MKMSVIKSVMIVFAVMACFTQAQKAFSDQSNDDQLTVTKAVAPIYPPIAKSANASGEIIVEVKINSAGEVVSTKASEGYPLLKMVAERAASRWHFVAGATAIKERHARLKFIFRLVDDYKQVGTSFNPPYQVEIAVTSPKVEDIKSY